jgi:hypothetical protein
MPELGGELVAVAEVEVHAGKLVVVAVGADRGDVEVLEAVELARGVGLGIILQIVQRDWIQAAGGDHVVGERRARDVRGRYDAGGRIVDRIVGAGLIGFEQGGEVALAFGGGGDGRKIRGVGGLAGLVLPTGGFVLPPDGKFTDITNINSIFYLNPHVTVPYVQQWNLGLGFQWGNNYGLEMNYVGTKTTNLFGPSAIFNAINLQEYSTEFQAGLNMTQMVPNPQGIKGANGPVIMFQRQNSLRPLSTLGDITDPLEQGLRRALQRAADQSDETVFARLSVQRELQLDEGDGRQLLHGPVLRHERHSGLG